MNKANNHVVKAKTSLINKNLLEIHTHTLDSRLQYSGGKATPHSES